MPYTVFKTILFPFNYVSVVWHNCFGFSNVAKYRIFFNAINAKGKTKKKKTAINSVTAHTPTQFNKFKSSCF